MTALAALPAPAVPGRTVVVVPLGSTEQHGPHLPLGTDTLVATAVAERVAAALGAVLAPPVAVGASGEHQGFPGTLSIGTTALTTVIVELVRSASLWAGRIVLVNGHGGNVDGVVAAVERLVAEGHDVAWAPCAVPSGDAHAGRTETSLVLHLAPHLVVTEAAAAGETRPLGEVLPELRRGGVAAVSSNGVLGDPSGASAAEGARLLDAMVATALGRLGVAA